MLFASDTIKKTRQELWNQAEAGRITKQEMFQRALELDEFDTIALVALGGERLEAGDREAAAAYLWRAATADPCLWGPWFQLNACLANESQELKDGLLELAFSKTLRSPEGIEEFLEDAKDRPVNGQVMTEELMEALCDHLHEKRRSEPPEVSERLRLHRLADEVLDAGGGLDDELVDEIVAEGTRAIPVLVGILRGMATDSLGADDPEPAAASLAMLGEIGDPVVLPELVECITVNDDQIQNAARWALMRIWSKRPDESFDAVQKIAAEAGKSERAIIAVVLAVVPDHPGKRELLISLLDGLAACAKNERHDLFMSVAQALLAVDGATKGTESVRSLYQQHAGELPKRTRDDLREAVRAQPALDEERKAFEAGIAEETVYDFCGGRYVDDEDHDTEDENIEEEDEFEEDDGFIPAPVRRTIDLGRNDPCWCGSGKKYKKCHMDADEHARTMPAAPSRKGPAAVRNEDPEATLRRRVIDFIMEALGKKEMLKALEEFAGDELPAGVDEQSMQMESLDWIMHDYVSPRLGRTMIEEFIRRSPGGLNARERKMLEAWNRSRYSLYEVQEVRPESGVRLKDLLAGGEFFVEDVSTSKRAAKWDCCLARVEELDGRHHFTAVVQMVPRTSLEQLKDWAFDAQLRSGMDWDRFLRTRGHRLRQEAHRLTRQAVESMRVVSAEGDEVVFSQARYQILDEGALRRALDGSSVLVSHGDGEYGWLAESEDAHGMRRSFGQLRIADNRLILECATRQRLERGKALLAGLAGEHLRHLGDNFTSAKSAMRNPGTRSVEKPSGISPDLERELVGKFMAEHYDKWPDTPLPALDGRTPREAVATPEGRAQVAELVKLLENGEERKRRDGLAWYDMAAIREKLGVLV